MLTSPQHRLKELLLLQAPEAAETSFSVLKMLNFSSLSSDLMDKQSEFWKNDFIFLILAYPGSRTCF